MGDILAEEPHEYSGTWRLEVKSPEGSFSDHVALRSRWEGNPRRSGGEGRQGRVTLTKVERTARARSWRLEEGNSSIGRFLNLEPDR